MPYSVTVYTHLDEGIDKIVVKDIDGGLTYNCFDSDMYGETITDFSGNVRFTAQMNSGYKFVQWVYREGSTTGTVQYSTSNPFTYRGGQNLYIRAETEEDSSSGSTTWETVLLDNMNNIDTKQTESIYIDAYTIYRISVSPKHSGILTVYSEGNLDTIGYLSQNIWMNTDGSAPFSTLTENDDSGDSDNFKFSYTVEAGEEYYIFVRCYDGDDEGDVDIIVIPPTESTVVSGGGMYIYLANEGWVKYTPYIYVNGDWEQCSPCLFVNNNWEQGT